MKEKANDSTGKEIIKVPEGLAEMQTILELDGLTVVEACLLVKKRRGLMFLQDHLLLFVQNGVYTVRYGEQEHTVRRGEMVLLQKSIVVEYDKTGDSENDDALDYIQFFIKDELLKDFLKIADIRVRKDARTAPAPVFVKKVGERLSKYLDSVKLNFSETQSIQSGLIKIKLLELLFDLAISDEDILRQLLSFRKPVHMSIPAVMEENLLNPVSLEDLAYLSGRSLSSFKRDFRTIYNMPPAAWIREKRLAKAHDLLSNSSDISVTDAGLIAGFKNVAHFSRAFKERFGRSPAVFKEKSEN